MKSESMEKWTWVLIYVGMGIAMLGLWMPGGDAVLAYGLTVIGGLMVASGVVLIWLRSRVDKRGTGPGAPR